MSQIIQPWRGWNEAVVPAVEGADPARYLRLEDDSFGKPVIMLRLPVNAVRAAPFEIGVPGYEGVLEMVAIDDTKRGNLLRNSGMTDGRAVSRAPQP